MAYTMLASTVPYLDIAIGVILGLGLLLGAIRGFGKSLKNSFIVIVLISLMLSGVTAEALKGSSMGISITEQLTGSLVSAGGEIVTTPIYFDEANNYYYVVVGGNNVEFAEALQQTSLGWMALIMKALLPTIMKGQSGISLVDKLAPALTNIIFLAIAFVLLCIVIKLLFIIINKLYQALLDKVYILKVLDKLLGAVYSGVKAMVLVIIGMAVVSWVASMNIPSADVLQQQIEISTIGKWLVENNIIGQIFSRLFGV